MRRRGRFFKLRPDGPAAWNNPATSSFARKDPRMRSPRPRRHYTSPKAIWSPIEQHWAKSPDSAERC